MCLRAVDSASSLQKVQMGSFNIAVQLMELNCTNIAGQLVLSGYDPYAGYYNQDGTTYAYDPNTYTAPATSAPPADPGTIAPAATQTTADPTIAAPSVAVPLVATASTSVDATPVATAADSPANPAPLTADQTAAAAQSIGAEHAANLLSVDEKQNLELQQEAAETARKEAEERYQKAEEQRRNAKVTCTLTLS